MLIECYSEKQAEAKKLEDLSLYLNLPATKLELEEKGYSATGKSIQNLTNCTISKDSFQISTLVCSTKLTQNGNSFSTRLHSCTKVLLQISGGHLIISPKKQRSSLASTMNCAILPLVTEKLK